jgi:hypothetical protein
VATAPGAARIDYPHRRAGHCGSGALRDLLEFHGLSWTDEPASEGMAFGLGAGLDFIYVELGQMDPPLYMIGRGPNLERAVVERIGGRAHRRETDEPAEGWALLREQLDAGRPTLINADIAHLEYLRVRLQMTMHVIVVTGYDEAQGVAFIADNDRDEIQRCSLKALARARHSDGFPRPNRHSTWLLDLPPSLPDPEPAIRAAMAEAVAHMRGRQADGMQAPAEACGLAGVRSFGDAYRQWPAGFPDRLDAALRGLRVFIVKAGTGGAMFRSLHAGFLHDSAALLGDSGLRALAAAYDELARTWVALAEAIDADGDPVAAHAAGLPRVEEIVRLEAGGVEAMERWLAG